MIFEDVFVFVADNGRPVANTLCSTFRPAIFEG